MVLLLKMVGRHTGHCTVRENGQYLNASDITVATILGNAGYHTALIGKWGLGMFHPTPQVYILSMQGIMAQRLLPTTKDFSISMVTSARRMPTIIIHHSYGEMRYTK